MAVQSSSRNNRCQSFQHSNDLFRSRSTGDERDDEEAVPSPVVRTIPPRKSEPLYRFGGLRENGSKSGFILQSRLAEKSSPPSSCQPSQGDSSPLGNCSRWHRERLLPPCRPAFTDVSARHGVLRVYRGSLGKRCAIRRQTPCTSRQTPCTSWMPAASARRVYPRTSRPYRRPPGWCRSAAWRVCPA